MRNLLFSCSLPTSMPQHIPISRMPSMAKQSSLSALQIECQIDTLHRQWLKLKKKYEDGADKNKLGGWYANPSFTEKQAFYEANMRKMDHLMQVFAHYLENEKLSAQLKEAIASSLKDSKSRFGSARFEVNFFSHNPILVKDPFEGLALKILELRLSLRSLHAIPKEHRKPFWALAMVFSIRSFITIASACASVCLGLGVVASIHVFLSILSVLSFCLNVFGMHEEMISLWSQYEGKSGADLRQMISEIEDFLLQLEDLHAHIQRNRPQQDYDRMRTQTSIRAYGRNTLRHAQPIDTLPRFRQFSKGQTLYTRSTPRITPRLRSFNRPTYAQLNQQADLVSLPLVSSESDKVLIEAFKDPTSTRTTTDQLGKYVYAVLRSLKPHGRQKGESAEQEDGFEMIERPLSAGL
jgi:hypothetical protein